MKTRPEKIEYTDSVEPNTIMSKTDRGDVFRRSPGMPILLELASKFMAANGGKLSAASALQEAKVLIDTYNNLINDFMNDVELEKFSIENSTKCVLSGE